MHNLKFRLYGAGNCSSVAIIHDTKFNQGAGAVMRLAAATGTALGGTPANGIAEEVWTTKFINVRVANPQPDGLNGMLPPASAVQPRHFAVKIAVRVGCGPIALRAEPIEETKKLALSPSTVPRRPAMLGIKRREPTTGSQRPRAGSIKFSDRKIAARLFRPFRRPVRARDDPDYCSFPMGSDFQSNRPLTIRLAEGSVI